MDEKTKKNALIGLGVLLVEALILKAAKSFRLWFYISIPILIGFALITNLIKPFPKKTKRNLK